MQKLAMIAMVLAACDVGPPKEDYKKVKPEDVQEKKPAPPPPKKVLTAAELGNCHLTASGAVSADQTTPGGRPATNISYWMSEEDRKSMMGVDGFVVNCNGRWAARRSPRFRRPIRCSRFRTGPPPSASPRRWRPCWANRRRHRSCWAWT